MLYCPKCGYEYKPTVVTCPDCGERLITKPIEAKITGIKPERTKAYESKIEPRLKLLYVTNKATNARLLKETLENNGITCIIKRGPSGLVKPDLPMTYSDVGIYVKEEDFEKSCEIKEQIVDSL